MKIKISNGMVICPTEFMPKKRDIYIDAGKIVSENNVANFQADRVIDATEQWIIPSLVDLKGRIHTPELYGQHDNGIKERLAYQSSGFSHVACFPNNAHCFDRSTSIHSLTQVPIPITIAPVGALTVGNLGEQLNDYQALFQAGCIAFSAGLNPIPNLAILRSAYELLASANYLAIICPQEPSLATKGCAHEGKIATRLGLKSIPRSAETIALLQHLALIEATGLRAHFTGLTSYESIDIIRHYKNKGLKISCDIAIAHLHLTEVDVGEFNTLCHVNPPLRATEDLLALRKALLDDVIDAIVSDHCPLMPSHKLAPFDETLPGMSTIDVFLKLCLKSYEELATKENVSLNQWIAKFTLTPLKILGLPGGTLQPNETANLIVIHPKSLHVIQANQFKSGFKQSPFDGWSVNHQINHVILNGQIS